MEPYPADASLTFAGLTTQGFTNDTLTPNERVVLNATFTYRAPPGAWSDTPVPVTIRAEGNHSGLRLDPPEFTGHVNPGLVRTEVHEENVTMKTTLSTDSKTPYGTDAGVLFTADAEGGTCVYPPVQEKEWVEWSVGFHDDWTVRAMNRYMPTDNETVSTGIVINSNSNAALRITTTPIRPTENGSMDLPTGFLAEPGETKRQLTLTTESRGLTTFWFAVEATPEPNPDNIQPGRNHISINVDREWGPLGELPETPSFLFVLILVGFVAVAQRRR